MDSKFLRVLGLTFLIQSIAWAGLPPTTSKDSTDTTDVTTFKYRFPNFTGTHTATVFSLGVNSIAGGGTGQVTANAALNALLPSQATFAGYVLQTDGTNTSWASSLPGTIPSAHASSTSVVTSATTTYVTAISTTITTTATSAPVSAKATGTFTVTGAVPTVLKYRVSINGVAGQEQLLSLTAITTNYTAATQYISAALGPGTYTILFEIARNSGTGTVSFFEGTLDAIALQGASSNGITQLTGALQAGPGSGSQALTGTLPIANGGTNQTGAAVNGAVVYSTASAYGYTAAGALGQVLRSAGASAPTWTAETFPASTTINQILYSSAANVVSGLATTNTGALVTSSTGVPSLASGSTANRLLRTNGTTVSFAQAALATDVSGTLPVANGGTGLTSAFAAGRVMYSNGSTLAADAFLTYDAANNRFTVGNGGTSRLSAVVQTTDVQPNDTALNVFSRSATKAAMNLQNENTLPSLDMTNSGGTAVGANILAESSRGTLAARTQSNSSDILFSLTAHGYAAAAYSTGFGASMAVAATETVTNTTNGSDMFFSTTPNGGAAVVEHLRIKQSGETILVNSHLKSTQTTPPTVTVQAGAGTGASCTIANATDKAGEVTITTGTLGVSTGSYCQVNFNTTYGVAPICVLTPASSTLSTSTYVTRATGNINLNFALAGGISSTYIINYHCEETQ